MAKLEKKLTLKEKLAAAKNKMASGTPAKKAPAKKAPAKKPTDKKRKKAIGFEISAKDNETLSKRYEDLQGTIDQVAESLGEFLEGKRAKATDIRTLLQTLTKSCKLARAEVLTAKQNMKPLYKD